MDGILMSVTSTRYISITFTSDVTGTEKIVAAANTSSPGSITVHTLALGLNTITVPVAGAPPTCATIIPPAGNTQSIILKGVTGDTDVRIHNTDPTSLGLDNSVATFVLTAGGTVTGLRIIRS